MKSRILLIVISLFASFALHAEDTLQNYDVELLIFRVVRPNATAENWTIEQSQKDLPSAATNDSEETPTSAVTSTASPNNPPPPAPTESTFAPLATTQFKLNGLEETLRRGKSYLPIAHIGWTQPGFPLDNAPMFSLQSFIPAFLPDNIALSCRASLARGRYLHLSLDLTYQAPDGQRYVLREQRRMRSNEKHYFDHPYFGVIALITPRDK